MSKKHKKPVVNPRNTYSRAMKELELLGGSKVVAAEGRERTGSDAGMTDRFLTGLAGTPGSLIPEKAEAGGKECVPQINIDSIRSEWNDKFATHKQIVIGGVAGMAILAVLGIWGIIQSYASDIKQTTRDALAQTREEMLRDMDKVTQAIEKSDNRLSNVEKQIAEGKARK